MTAARRGGREPSSRRRPRPTLRHGAPPPSAARRRSHRDCAATRRRRRSCGARSAISLKWSARTDGVVPAHPGRIGPQLPNSVSRNTSATRTSADVVSSTGVGGSAGSLLPERKNVRRPHQYDDSGRVGTSGYVSTTFITRFQWSLPSASLVNSVSTSPGLVPSGRAHPLRGQHLAGADRLAPAAAGSAPRRRGR